MLSMEIFAGQSLGDREFNCEARETFDDGVATGGLLGEKRMHKGEGWNKRKGVRWAWRGGFR